MSQLTLGQKMKKLTVGILETGLLAEDLATSFSSFPAMFQDLLEYSDSELNYETYSVVNGTFPSSVNNCHAWLITGSKHAAYETHPWTEPLCQLIREAFKNDIPLIGICFGHQIICHALGGVVEKSNKGWGIGASTYNLLNTPIWMDRAKHDAFTIQAFHQDQVISTPPNTQVIASSALCPNAALIIEDKALTFQGHPEFNSDFSEALINSKRDQNIIPQALANSALSEISTPLNQSLVSQWICAFIRLKLN